MFKLYPFINIFNVFFKLMLMLQFSYVISAKLYKLIMSVEVLFLNLCRYSLKNTDCSKLIQNVETIAVYLIIKGRRLYNNFVHD